MGIAVLRAAQQPFLDRGGAISDAKDQAAVDVQIVQQLRDSAAFVIVAHHGGKDRLGAERGQHGGHAAGAAQAVLPALDPQNGNRGFGADPLHVAPDVAVQHHVAHQQHPRPGVLLQ